MSMHSSTLLLFGATGDLSRRMLLPSLYALHADGLINPDLRIFGTARSALTDEAFRDMARGALCEFLPDDRKAEGLIDAFLQHLSISLEGTRGNNDDFVVLLNCIFDCDWIIESNSVCI